MEPIGLRVDRHTVGEFKGNRVALLLSSPSGSSYVLAMFRSDNANQTDTFRVSPFSLAEWAFQKLMDEGIIQDAAIQTTWGSFASRLQKG